jgi:hypothetical protein
MNRISKQDSIRIKSYPDPDDRMIEVLSILKEIEVIPEVGKLYTFIYSPKTPNIEYDQNPLVLVTHIYKWGFKGFNFHWNENRNYTWIEIVGYLHYAHKDELNTLLNLGYQKFRINS